MPLVYLNYNGENDSTYDKSQFDSPLAWTSSNWLIFPRFVLSSLVNFRFTKDILELFYCSQVKHTLSQWSPGKGRCNCVKIIPNNGYSFIESISLFFCPVFRSSAKFSLFETHRVHSFDLFEILDNFVRNERRTKNIIRILYSQELCDVYLLSSACTKSELLSTTTMPFSSSLTLGLTTWGALRFNSGFSVTFSDTVDFASDESCFVRFQNYKLSTNYCRVSIVKL